VARTVSALGSAAPPARTSSPSIPVPAVARTTSGSALLPPSNKPASAASSGGFQSGLSAAFTEAPDQTNLGALGGLDGAFSLASLDGADDASAPAAAQFGPPGDAAGEPMPASIGPATAPTPAVPSRPSAAHDAPVDLFAPPEAAEAEAKMELAAEDEPRMKRAAKAASIPPATQPASAAVPSRGAQGGHAPAEAAPAAAVAPRPARRPGWRGALADARIRMAAGVAAAILLGFLPAHAFASLRERAAFGAIDDAVEARQGQVDSYEAWQQLDPMRENQLAKKKGARRDIMIVALLVWAAAGGGIAYGWFRRVPWDKVLREAAS
jgi:hypothetical protein